MSEFFRISRGLELDEAVQMLQGTGSPTSADTDAAPRGSIYQDTSANVNGLNLWSKFDTGTGVSKWALLTSKAYVDANSGTLSWREPVAVRDNTSTTTGAIKTDLDTDDLIQGVAVTVGMRILGSNVTGNKNIFIIGGVSGNWTLTEDANLETSGDATYVIGGTDAGKTYTYTGTDWVLINQASEDELGYIRTFIGKASAGSVLPTYTSTNQITQSSNLQTAISSLDTQIGADPTTNTIITSGNTVNANVGALGVFAEFNGKTTTANAVTTVVTVDSVVASMAKWLVHVSQNGSPANMRAYELFAAHNGTTIDSTRYATLALGSNPTGLNVAVTFTGGNTINLTVTSTTSVDVKAKRVAAF